VGERSVSYDNGYRVCYTFSGLTNATVAAAAAIRVPTHLGVRAAAIEDINITPTVAIVNTTLAAVIQIGTPATSGKYAAQSVSTLAGLAVGAAFSCADIDGRVAAYNPNVTTGAGSTNKGFIDLFNDGDALNTLLTTLKIGTVAGTGTPAGTFTANIMIRWF
jgi:hypothetical protein